MEINKQFLDNLKKILEYNTKRISSKERIFDTTVQIPLTPIEIEASQLYFLFKILYPIFINDQQNILDLIKSETNGSIIQAILYRTKKAGIHVSIEKIPSNYFKDMPPSVQENNYYEFDTYLNNLQQIVADKKQAKISSIRIFDENIITSINSLYSNDKPAHNLEFYRSLIDFIQEAFEQTMFLVYPIPGFIKFFEYFLKFLNKIRLSNIFTYFMEIFPDSSIGILFKHEKGDFFVDFTKAFKSRDKNLLKIRITSPNIINEKSTNKYFSVKNIFKKEKFDLVYQFNLEDFISLVRDIFSVPFPLNKETIQFIAQKILFGFRSYDNRWYRAPLLRLYNLKRFLLRILGFNLNIKKLSHWTIPTKFFEVLTSSFGLNSKFLILLTDINSKNGKKGLKNSLEWSGIVEFENGSLMRLIPIEKKHLLKEEGINRLEDIKSKATEEHGSISAVLKVDKILMKHVIRFLVFQTPTLSIFKISKVLKQFKQDLYFEVHPEVPFVAFLKKARPFKLIKAITSVIVNKYEF
ncbi:MAG: hypothetical protein ACFFAS_15830 [Promethearchaeota archaeon]